MASPVSLCSLKRVEVHDGSTRKSFDAESQASDLLLSIECQKSMNVTNSLILQIQAGFQPLLSVRLSDLLKPTVTAQDIVSSDSSELRLSIRIPSQSQVLVVFFGEARDHNLTVCTLQKAGFQVNREAEPTSSGTSILQESTNPLSASSRPRLSSTTPISAFGQTPQLPPSMPTRSTSSIEDNLRSAAWPSCDHGGGSISQPQLPSHALLSPFPFPQSSALPQVPSAFGSMPSLLQPNTHDAYRGMADQALPYPPQVASMLRNAVHSMEPLRSWSNPGIASPYGVSLTSHDIRVQNHYSQNAGQTSLFDPQHTMAIQMGNSRSGPGVGRKYSGVDESTPMADAHVPEATFRDLLPPPRQLPFDPMNSKDKTLSKSVTSIKQGASSSDASGSREGMKKTKKTSTTAPSQGSLPIPRKRKGGDKASRSTGGEVTKPNGRARANGSQGKGVQEKQAPQDPNDAMGNHSISSPNDSAPKKPKQRALGLGKEGGRQEATLGSKSNVSRKPAAKRRRCSASSMNDSRDFSHEKIMNKKLANPTPSPSTSLDGFASRITSFAAANRSARKSSSAKKKQKQEPVEARSSQQILRSPAYQMITRSNTRKQVKESRASSTIRTKEANVKLKSTRVTAKTKPKSTIKAPNASSSRPRVVVKTSREKPSVPQPALKSAATEPRTTVPLTGNAKGALLQPACVECHNRHSRCSRAHPTCDRCKSLGIMCVYPSKLSAQKRDRLISGYKDHATKVLLSTTPPLTPGNVNRIRLRPNCASAPQVICPVVFDANMQRQLNELTDPLFQQYESDVARGCDEETSARFYLDRIHCTRKGFWEQLIHKQDDRYGVQLGYECM